MAAWAVPVKEERPRWRLPNAVTATSQHRFNHQRLFEACGDIPPAELEPPATVRTLASPRPANN